MANQLSEADPLAEFMSEDPEVGAPEVKAEDSLDEFMSEEPSEDPLSEFMSEDPDKYDPDLDPSVVGDLTWVSPEEGPSVVPPMFLTPAKSSPRGRWILGGIIPGVGESEEDLAQRKAQEFAQRRGEQDAQEAQSAFAGMSVEEIENLIPDTLPDQTEEEIELIPVDMRPDALADWGRVQSIANTPGIPKRKVGEALVWYTDKYHPNYRRFLDERLKGTWDRALAGGFEKLDDPTKFGGGYGNSLIGAMWSVDKPARAWRAGVATQFEHTKNRIFDPESEPAVLTPAQWKERQGENYAKMVWTPERGNELAKMRYILNRLPGFGVGGTGFGLGVPGEAIDWATEAPRSLLLKGGKSDLGQHFPDISSTGLSREEYSRMAREAQGDPEKMKEFFNVLEKEWEGRHGAAADYWTKAGYKIGEIFSHMKGGTTPEDWQEAAQEAVARGSEGGKEFLGEIQTATYDPLNLIGGGLIKNLFKGGVMVTRLAARGIEELMEKQAQLFLKGSNFAPDVSPKRAATLARETSRKIVEDNLKDAADIAYRNGRHNTYGVEQVNEVAKFLAPDEKMAAALDDYVKKNKIVIKGGGETPAIARGEAVWSHLQREAGARKQLYEFVVGPIEGVSPTGKITRSSSVNWVTPEGKWGKQKVVNVFDARKARLGIWLTQRTKIPAWDIYRRRASSILDIDKAQPYATGKGSAAKLIPEQDILHPARFKDTELRDMQNLRRRATDAARMAKFIKELTKLSDNPEVQQLGAMLSEVGHHMPMTEDQLLTVAKLQNVESTIARVASGDLTDLPQNFMDELQGSVGFEEFGKQLQSLAVELEKTRGLADDAVVPGADGKPLPAKEARKQLLRTASANIKLIRELISDSLVDSFRRERQLRALEETAPIVDKIAALKEARENLAKAISEKVWHGAEDFDQALENLKQFKGNWTKSLDEIVRPSGPAPDFAKDEVATVARLQDEGFLPRGEMKDWSAERRRIETEIQDVFKEVEKQLPPIEKLKGKAKKILGLRDNQVEPFKLLLGARAKAWAFLNGLPERYADAWYAKQNLSFRYATDRGAIDNKGRLLFSLKSRETGEVVSLAAAARKSQSEKAKKLERGIDERNNKLTPLMRERDRLFAEMEVAATRVEIAKNAGSADVAKKYEQQRQDAIRQGAEVENKAKALFDEQRAAVQELKEILSKDYDVFEPTQIKSVDNVGTWGMDDPRILHEAGADPAFRAWFSGSKLVDEAGEPLRLYHGTTADIEAFTPSTGGMFGPGVYLTPNPKMADSYALESDLFGKPPPPASGPGPSLVPVYASIKNPMFSRDVADIGKWSAAMRKNGISTEEVLERAEKGGRYRGQQDAGIVNDSVYMALGSWDESGAALAKKVASDAGFDGIIEGSSRAWKEGARDVEIVAFDPAQVKSTQNVGTWAPDDPRILFEAGDEAPRLPYNPEQGPKFYSVMEKLIEDAPDNLSTVKEFRDWLGSRSAQSKFVKQEELVDALVPMMDGDEAITKKELINLVRSNRRPWSVRTETAPQLGTVGELPPAARDYFLDTQRQAGRPDPADEIVRLSATSEASGLYAFPGKDADFSQGHGFSRSGAVHPQAVELSYPTEQLLKRLVEPGFLMELESRGMAKLGIGGRAYGPPGAASKESRSRFLSALSGDVPELQAPSGRMARIFDVDNVTVDHSFLDASGATQTSIYGSIEDVGSFEIRINNLLENPELSDFELTGGTRDLIPNGIISLLDDLGLPSREGAVEMWTRDVMNPESVRHHRLSLTPDVDTANRAGFDELANLARNNPDKTVRGNAPGDHFAHRYDAGHQAPSSYGQRGPSGPAGTDYTEMTFSLDELISGERSFKRTMEAVGDDYHFGSSFSKEHDYSPNIFLHLRFDTIYEDGKKVLRILEIQSDLHGHGRQKGYGGGGAPSAPYKKSWQQLGARAAVDHAVKHGFDEIVWEGASARTGASKGEARGRMTREPAKALYDEKIKNEISRALGKKATPWEPRARRIMSKGILSRVKSPEALHKKLGVKALPTRPDELPGDFTETVLSVLKRPTTSFKDKAAFVRQAADQATSTDDLAKRVGESWGQLSESFEKDATAAYKNIFPDKDLPPEVKSIVADRTYLVHALLTGDHKGIRRHSISLKRSLKKFADDEAGYARRWWREVDKAIKANLLDFDKVIKRAVEPTRFAVSEVSPEGIGRPHTGASREVLRAWAIPLRKNTPWTAVDHLIPMDSKHSFASKFLDKTRKSAEGRTAYPEEWRISISDEAADRIRTEGQPLYARDSLYVRGQIEFFKDNRKIITIFEKGDFSTLVHETGHLFRRDLPIEEQKRASAWVEKQLGKKAFRKNGSWSTLAEEIFAQAFVKYMKTGEFPEAISRAGLQGTFIKYKMWMREVYVAIAGQSSKAFQKGTDGKYHPTIEEMLDGTDKKTATFLSRGRGKKFTEDQVSKMSRDRKAKLIAEKRGGHFDMSPDIKGVFDRLFDPRAIDESPLTNELRLSRREYELSGPLDQIFSAAKYRNSIRRIMDAAGFADDEIKKTIKRALSKESTSIAVATQTMESASNRLAGAYHSPKSIRGFDAPKKAAFGKGRGAFARLKRLLVDDVITNTMLSEAEVRLIVDEVLPKMTKAKVDEFLGKSVRERNTQWRSWIESVASAYVARHPGDPVNALPTMKRPRTSPTASLGARLEELWNRARNKNAQPADLLAFRKAVAEVPNEVDIPLEHRGKSLKALISGNEWTTVKSWVDAARKLLDEAADASSPADDVLEKANEIASKKRRVTTKQIKEANGMTEWIDGAINDLEDTVRRELILARKEGRDFSNAAAQASTDEVAMGAEEAVAKMLSGVGRSMTGIEPRATVRLPRKGKVVEQAGSVAKQIKKLEKQIKTTGAGKKLNNLQAALDELRKQATDVSMEVSPQRQTDRLNRLLKDFPEFSNELMETARLLNYDLRTPGEVWSEILNLRHEARAYGDYAQFQRDVAMDAFRKAEYAEILRDMSSDEVNKVVRLLKDPNRRLYGVGRKATPEAKRIAKKLGMVGTEDLTIGLKRGARAEKAGQKRVGEAFSPEEIEEALQVAELINDFMDEQLLKMQSAGRLNNTVDPAVVAELKDLGKRVAAETDKSKAETIQARIDYLRENKLVVPWTKDDFLQRVNLASYVPHILSSVTTRKVAVLRGRGLLPKEQTSGFEKFRKRASFFFDINDVARNDLATEMLYHMASNRMGPAWAPDGPFAKFADLDDVEELLSAITANDLEALFSKSEWDDAVKWARNLADLDEIYSLFETDVPTLLKYYTRSVDRVVSDAMYIEDMKEMFPLGRQIAELIQSGSAGWDDMRAKEYGYSRLTVEDSIQVTTRQAFPPELRKFSDLIQTRLAAGEDPGSIVRWLREMGITVDANVIHAYKMKPVYLPTPVVEYMRWMNTPDPHSGPLVHIYDGYLGVMKSQTTIASLAHIGMNFAGNYFSIWQKLGIGAFNPINHYYAYILNLDEASSLWKKTKSKEVDLGGRVDTFENWRRRIEAETAISEAPSSTGFQEEMFGSVRESRAPLKASVPLAAAGAATGFAAGAAAGPLGSAAGLTLGTWLGAFVSEVLSAGYKKGRSPVQVVRKGARKVWDNEVKDFMDKASKHKTGNTKDAILYWGERTVGLTDSAAIASVLTGPMFPVVSAIGGVSFPSYMRMMADLNSGIELQGRLTLGVGRLRKGDSLRDASFAVDDAMRNYSHLTPWERHFLRRFFFFYTWDAGNVRFQLRQAVQNPRSFAMLKNFLNSVQNGSFSEGDLSSMPPEMRYDIILRTGYAKMFNVHGIPQQAAVEFLARTDHGVPLGSLSRMSPPLGLGMEYLAGAGRSLFYGKKWEDVNNVRAWKDTTPLIRQFVGVPMEDGKLVPTGYVKVYNKHGEWTGKKRPVYKSVHPRNFYAASKVLPFRVIREHNKLIQSTFMPRSVDAGDIGALATPEERTVAYMTGVKPMAMDPEGQIGMHDYMLLERIEEIYRSQGVPLSHQIKRLREELGARGMLVTEGAEPGAPSVEFPLHREKKDK